MTGIIDLGSLTIFIQSIARDFFKKTTRRAALDLNRAIVHQIAEVTLRSLSTVAFAGIFVGAILVLQFNLILQKYDAEILLGGLNTSAVIREVGPLIISFLLAGKVGAYTTAELGTMRVTEQIDAIRCLGTDPIRYLIVPRFIAIIVSSVILLTLSLMISIGGSMAVASLFCGINAEQFIQTIPRFVGLGVFFTGLFKCAVYGTIVAGVACHQGYVASGGATGVGRAVTRAAIRTNLYIIFAQFMMSHITLWFAQGWGD